MTDTDKELAKAWAKEVSAAGHAACTDEASDVAAARYILSTLADDRDARIEALTRDVERLTKERDEAKRGWVIADADVVLRGTVFEKPAAEDAKLDAAMAALEGEPHTTAVWCSRVEATLALLAARVKEMRR